MKSKAANASIKNWFMSVYVHQDMKHAGSLESTKDA